MVLTLMVNRRPNDDGSWKAGEMEIGASHSNYCTFTARRAGKDFQTWHKAPLELGCYGILLP